ncbi:MAG: ABC transporter ATP-binding protein [Spirochaetales bacterium]|nr:ABC transporter ATP-binding protein [Spirochaetales bacterium]
MSILQVSELTAGYGAQDVLFGVSLVIEPGEIVAVMGPNGSGKSTLLKVISGALSARAGEILYKGESLLNRSPQQIVKQGLSWVPQEENIFPSLTVRENLEIGAYPLRGGFEERIEEVCGIFPQLRERMGQTAGDLSGGQRQMLAVARGLMIHPELLLLDEPTAGLAPNLVQIMLEKIREIAVRMGNAVLLVSQTIDSVRLSNRGYLLSAGRIRYEDRTEALLGNQEIKDLYFGTQAR